ncbi:MAG: ATP-grasp domain-containing protein [Deltaproteobacteria bacterium]|nr:ATP-grasp domain-containing protein [Deltaproteobacteria bacterium]
MRVAILHNHDFDSLDDDPAREARQDVISVAAALRDALVVRHAVELVPLGRAPFAELQALCDAPPDVAINLCESVNGDARGEALVPLALELAGVPVTGSPALGISVALHKPKCKEVLRARGIPTPDWVELADPTDVASVTLGYPLIVKPSREDASSGIHAHSVVHDAAELAQAVREVVTRFKQSALVERFVVGRELNVALLGEPLRALPLGEIDFSALPAHLPAIVTYAGKWDESSVECLATPPRPSTLSGELAQHVVDVAVAAFSAVGCRDYGRVDVRLAADGTPYVIDVNPNCDLSPTAGFARAAAQGGLGYAELAEELVQLAWRRHGAAPAARWRPSAPRPDARGDLGVLGQRGELRSRAG